MTEKKPEPKRTGSSTRGFTDEERAAMREAVRERTRPRSGKEDGEREVLEKIAEMPAADRVIAERLHAIVKSVAPTLSPRTWYGMPAYSKDGDVLCFLQPASKFKARYATLGFNDGAHLDEGQMWPTAFAVKQLTGAEEARIAALLKRAVG